MEDRAVTNIYNSNSFGDRSGSIESAKIIAPIITRMINPNSVVDLGCGTGEFLSIFRYKGINDILGIDGPWINKEKLMIPAKNFFTYDLNKKLRINRRFDLAISLEVAEHIPKFKAEIFIDNLVALSNVILFSAAIPYQGGLYHRNEQWPNYWAKIFRKKNYVPVDCIRMKIWNNKQVNYWYCQNTILYVSKDYLNSNEIKFDNILYQNDVPGLIHPELYLNRQSFVNYLMSRLPDKLRVKIIQMRKKIF